MRSVCTATKESPLAATWVFIGVAAAELEQPDQAQGAWAWGRTLAAV